MEDNIKIAILEAIYGFCCNGVEKLSDVKAFVCKEFINGGLVEAEEKKALSSAFNDMMKFLRINRFLIVEFYEDDEPCFVTTSEFDEFLGYTFEGDEL